MNFDKCLHPGHKINGVVMVVINILARWGVLQGHGRIITSQGLPHFLVHVEKTTRFCVLLWLLAIVIHIIYCQCVIKTMYFSMFLFQV